MRDEEVPLPLLQEARVHDTLATFPLREVCSSSRPLRLSARPQRIRSRSSSATCPWMSMKPLFG